MTTRRRNGEALSCNEARQLWIEVATGCAQLWVNRHDRSFL
jgi:hypothetical protein